MTIDTKASPTRRALRAAAVSTGLALGSLAVPALAAPPDSDPWRGEEDPSTLQDLLFLVGVPVAVFLVVTLLVYLPSMMRRGSSEPALAFRERPEWFGGPRKGLDATKTTDTSTGSHAAGPEETGKGGASARW